MSTWILKEATPGPGLRVAVKDLIDVAGLPTTAGSLAVADLARPAAADAACLTGLRAAIARGQACLAGKVNLHEMAYGISGINTAFGTPVNPLDPALVPGGSSSGSAVAVATGEADIAYGSDTGGSIRIPAACCGVAGLKTTWGRVPLGGVWPLAPSLDTVGPLARDVAGLVTGMALLEPGFTVSAGPPAAVGRVTMETDPAIATAVDAALAATGWQISPVVLRGLDAAMTAAMTVLDAAASSTVMAAVIAASSPRSTTGEICQPVAASAASTAVAMAGSVSIVTRPTAAGGPADTVNPGSSSAIPVTRPATSRASGPTVSRLGASGHTPPSGTRPQVVFRPATPQHAAGIRIDPPVSEP